MKISNPNTRRPKMMVFFLAGVMAFASPGALVMAAPGGGGGITPSAGPQIDPAQSYRDGLAALEAGDYRTAEKKFGEVLRVVRDNPEANYYMGLAKIGRGKTKSSVRYFKRAVKERPNFVEARERLALVLIELDMRDDAVEHADALKAQRAGCETAACDDTIKVRLDQAIAAVDAAMANQSASLDALLKVADVHAQPIKVGEQRYLTAVSLINEERYGEAINTLYETQRIIGPHPDILNYLGFSHRKLGALDRARDYYAQALALDPDHLGANEYLGELYLEIGDIRAAKAQLATLDGLCTFGCSEREDLARLIDIREAERTAQR